MALAFQYVDPSKDKVDASLADRMKHAGLLKLLQERLQKEVCDPKSVYFKPASGQPIVQSEDDLAEPTAKRIKQYATPQPLLELKLYEEYKFVEVNKDSPKKTIFFGAFYKLQFHEDGGDLSYKGNLLNKIIDDVDERIQKIICRIVYGVDSNGACEPVLGVDTYSDLPDARNDKLQGVEFTKQNLKDSFDVSAKPTEDISNRLVPLDEDDYTPIFQCLSTLPFKAFWGLKTKGTKNIVEWKFPSGDARSFRELALTGMSGKEIGSCALCFQVRGNNLRPGWLDGSRHQLPKRCVSMDSGSSS